MSEGTVKELRDRAQHCRNLARVTRDKIVEAELLRVADEFEDLARDYSRKFRHRCDKLGIDPHSLTFGMSATESGTPPLSFAKSKTSSAMKLNL